MSRRTVTARITINGEVVETIPTFKFVGVHITRTSPGTHTSNVTRKEQHLYFLKKLRKP